MLDIVEFNTDQINRKQNILKYVIRVSVLFLVTRQSTKIMKVDEPKSLPKKNKIMVIPGISKNHNLCFNLLLEASGKSKR